MMTETKHPTKRVGILIAVGLCVALLGAFVTWRVIGRDTTVPCNGLTENERVRGSMGAVVQPGMSCAAFGDALVKATVGTRPGIHDRQQAQALKDVLVTLGSGQPDGFALDPALRLPLATALADYATDVHELLATLDTEYLTRDGRLDPPWESEGTYHVSVYAASFRDIVRAISEDPRAYAVLRMADTRHAAQQLAAVPDGAAGAAFSLPATKSARVWGVFDGIADSVTRTRNDEQARVWRTTAVDGLLREPATAHGDRNGLAVDLVTAWLKGLEDTPAPERFARLATQGTDMVGAWTQTRKTGKEVREELLNRVGESQHKGREEVDLP
ncbi:hypothetical protein [Streptomyces cinereoruber]|uniref:hypothetical protein n=1 Tax=Streptomyces cinereoruber TaxID=67260 RepID=UPI0036521B19